MKEPADFSTLLGEASRLLFQRRSHVVFMAILGAMSALQYFFISELPWPTPPNTSEVDAWMKLLEQNLPLFLSIGVIATSFFLLQGALRGPLLFVLDETVRSIQRKRTTPPTMRSLFRVSLTSFLFETLYLLLCSAIFTVTFLPAFFSYWKNPLLLPLIFQCSALAFLFLSILFFFIKEYALFYCVLGRVTFRSGIELGYALFRKNIFLSLLFAVLILSLSFVFTFLLDLAIISSAVIAINPVFRTVTIIFLLAGTFHVFQEAARLLFFHSIATGRKKDGATVKVLPEAAPEPPPV